MNRRINRGIGFALLVLGLAGGGYGQDRPVEPLAGTRPLTIRGDIAAQLVAGVDRFLLREIDQSVARRARYWARDFSSPEHYSKSLEPNRRRLAHILGVRDRRVPLNELQLVGTTARPALVGRGDGFQVYAVRWPVIGTIHGEGLLLVPSQGVARRADVIALPDADQTPEQIAGLVEGVPPQSQFARRLAESGCRVVVPVLISRAMKARAPPGQRGRAALTNREYVYRSAFELGRHLIGYELQKVLALVDWYRNQAGGEAPKIGVIGYGEGGMLALYAAALDPRIGAACVSGYFGPRERIWEQPIDRNVFGLLEQFGDAELAAMVAPRGLVIDPAPGPQLTLPGAGGAPAVLAAQEQAGINRELDRVKQLIGRLRLGSGRPATSRIHYSPTRPAAFCRPATLSAFLGLTVYGDAEKGWVRTAQKPPEHFRESFDPQPRQDRQVQEMDDYNQWLLRESRYVRRDFMNIGLRRYDRPDGKNRLDTGSLDSYQASIARFRRFFRREVIGQFDYPLLPPNPRTRKSYDEQTWTGYEVVLDVFPDVIAYGILLVPKDLQPGQKRPVVVCQHGLEGRPQDVVRGDHRAYHDFAAKLTEQGFITFAPQNLYIGQDKFRTLQRKANPIKKTLFSIMVPQHQQIVNWLKTLPYVDGDRIAFYGLSYGGKSAMRIPPLVEDYCLSICSGDFNEWVWKNASTRSRYSYVWTKEYEIFEFDLGSTFNYAEMAALIAPRPFMVERGHLDGVAPDEAVAYEFAKVRHLYAARLGIPDRCAIEWFVGPHTIHGKGTFDFLHKHLHWPKP